MWAPSRSPPISWWTERCTDSSVMILPRIWTCHMAKEAEPSCFKDTWNWTAAGGLPDRSVGNVSDIRDPKDSSERPCVKERHPVAENEPLWLFTLRKHTPTPGGHRLERLIQPNLRVDLDMWHPNMLLQQHHTIPDNSNAPKNLGLTTAIASGACSQVCEFTDHLYLAATDMDHPQNQSEHHQPKHSTNFGICLCVNYSYFCGLTFNTIQPDYKTSLIIQLFQHNSPKNSTKFKSFLCS